MPTYAYTCTSCHHGLEVKQSFTDDALTTCPECSGRLRKVFNSVGVVFKGSGFYRTDSRKPEGGTSSDSGSGSGSGAKESATKESASTSSSGSSDSSSSSNSSSGGSKGSSGSGSSSSGSAPAKSAASS